MKLVLASPTIMPIPPFLLECLRVTVQQYRIIFGGPHMRTGRLRALVSLVPWMPSYPHAGAKVLILLVSRNPPRDRTNPFSQKRRNIIPSNMETANRSLSELPTATAAPSAALSPVPYPQPRTLTSPPPHLHPHYQLPAQLQHLISPPPLTP